ncbi:hypothetical protein ACU4GD_18590 [Cupriavidus basilensis]
MRRLSAAFDQYWNNPLAVSVETLATPAETADAAASAGGAGAARPGQTLVGAETERKRIEAQGMTPPGTIDARASFLGRQFTGGGKRSNGHPPA